MGGWRADGSSSAASPARSRRGEARGPRSSLGARHDLSVNWRDAMRPVRDAAALGRNGADALRDATLRFFADAKNKGVPSTAEMDKKETASDLLTLVRAVNGFSATKEFPTTPFKTTSAEKSNSVSAEPPRNDLSSLRRGVDALVADLVALDAVALDNEVVAVLCAYYVARFSRRAEKTRGDDTSRSDAEADETSADAYKTVAALASSSGGSFFARAETEALVDLAIHDLLLCRTLDSRRHVLGALGAVASRVPAGALSQRAHAKIGEALSGLLDGLSRKTPSSVAPEVSLSASLGSETVSAMRLEESVAASRYYASLWRCAHLCASRDGARWPAPVVASLAGRVRPFLSFGVESRESSFFARGGGGEGGDSALGGDSYDASADKTVSSSSSARGYVPPHARDESYSDSDASDAETTGPSGSGRERGYGDRFGSSKVRANACACVASLARADPRGAHPFWTRLLPTSAAQYGATRTVKNKTPITLARVMLHDPSPRARAGAAAAVAQLFDAPASRQYLSAAETKLDSKTGLALRRVNFASLSSTLGDLAVATHGALTHAVASEPALACVPSACKACAALADAAPFGKLPRNLLPDAALAAWRRISSLQAKSGTRLLPSSSGGPNEDPELVSATVALLSALAATLGAKGAPASFEDALSRESGEDVFRESMTESKTKESFLKPADAADLSSIVPGLASLASDTTAAVAVRCEAFGALRAAAATHAAAVASHWRDTRVQAALPGLMFATRQNPVADKDQGSAEDRAAHASARFLAEFLIAAGGGKAAAALSAAVENDEISSAAAEDVGGSRKGSRKALAFALQPEASVALWTSVAAEHFPAMAAHASPLVRASGLSALTGLTLEALRGVSKAHRATLTETPRVLARSDDSANVRAAACRAVGALASFETADRFYETETDADSETVVGSLASDAALLVAAMRDGSKSVRLPASWAVANVCGALSFSARATSTRSESVGDSDRASEIDATLCLLAEACVEAATEEGDKVRANAARALGHVLAAADLAKEGGRVAARLKDITQALMSCLATGNAKTQWNACLALKQVFQNASAEKAQSFKEWSPAALRMCLMLVRDARHFKLRAHAAATLAAPKTREAFGNAYADVLSVVASAAEHVSRAASETAESARTEGGADGDPDAARHAPRLAARLAATLLGVAALGRPEDAAAARDVLIKKRETFRRVALEARRALENLAARERKNLAYDDDAALPDDPFGVGKSAEKKRDAAGTTHAARAHDDVAVGVSSLETHLNDANDANDVNDASSMDVSALAEALSPAKTDSARAADDAFGPAWEIAAAAAGLRRMYGALGGEANDTEAAFYERFVSQR
jgi:hypothetical protein